MASRKRTPTTGLSPKFIANLKPDPGTPYEVGDRGPAKGLRLRVTPQGGRSFKWYVAQGGKTRTITLGPWSEVEAPGHLTLAQAREALRKLKAAHQGGTLDACEADLRAGLGRPRAGQVIADALAAPMTVADLCERFYRDRILPFRQQPKSARYVLDHDVLPAIGALPVSALTKATLTLPVKRAVERGSAGHATTVLQIVKMATKYAYNHDLIPVDYAASLDRRYLGCEAHARSRYLAEPELAVYLRAMEPRRRRDRLLLGADEATLLGLAVLLRVGERPIALRVARWSDIDLRSGVWTQPPERQAKKKMVEREAAQPWEIPLARQTIGFLRRLRALTGRGDLVWPLSSNAANRALARLQACGDLRLDPEKERLVVYDLRRSLRAGLERLGVAYEVCEKIINHAVKGAVAATYARDPLLDRRREAVQRWADYLDRLAAPVPANVTPFPGRSAVVTTPAVVAQ